MATSRRLLALAVIVAVLIALDPWGHAPRHIGPAGPYGPIP